MDEQREHKHEGQRPAAEPTGEVADADLEQAAGGFLDALYRDAVGRFTPDDQGVYVGGASGGVWKAMN